MAELPSFLPFDETDFQIIRLLQQDGRASASEIARLLNANERTIRKRIDRLLETGALRLTAVVDPRVFGYALSVDIFLQVEQEEEAVVLESLLALPEISYLAYGQGTRELSLEARFKDTEEMHAFIHRQLPALPGVTVVRYALVPKILRNIDEWMPRSSDFGRSDLSHAKAPGSPQNRKQFD